MFFQTEMLDSWCWWCVQAGTTVTTGLATLSGQHHSVGDIGMVGYRHLLYTIYTHFTSVYYRDIPSYPLLFCLIYTYFFNICIHHGRYDVTAEIVTFNLSFSQTLFLPSFLLTLNIHQRWYHLNLRNFTISNVSAQQVGHTIYILISFPPNIDHNHTYYVLATLDSET